MAAVLVMNPERFASETPASMEVVLRPVMALQLVAVPPLPATRGMMFRRGASTGNKLRATGWRS